MSLRLLIVYYSPSFAARLESELVGELKASARLTFVIPEDIGDFLASDSCDMVICERRLFRAAQAPPEQLVQGVDPSLPVIIISGEQGEIDALLELGSGARHIVGLNKPDSLAGLIRSTLADRRFANAVPGCCSVEWRSFPVASALSRLCERVFKAEFSEIEICRDILYEAVRITNSRFGCLIKGENSVHQIGELPVEALKPLIRHTLKNKTAFFANNKEEMSVIEMPLYPFELAPVLVVPVFYYKRPIGVVLLALPATRFTYSDLAAVTKIVDFFSIAQRQLKKKGRIARGHGILSAKLAESAKNMEVARKYHLGLLSVTSKELGVVQSSVGVLQCESVGGDIVNVVLCGRFLVFYIADVSGHGVAAAFIATWVKACLDDWILTQRKVSPAKLINRLATMFERFKCSDGSFLTIFVGKVDLMTKKFSYVSAGHLMPLVRDGEVRIIDENTPDPPIIPDIVRKSVYRDRTSRISPNARILLYSDGITESSAWGHSLLGTTGLSAFFRDSDLSLVSLRRLLKEVGNREQQDDISWLYLDFNSGYRRDYGSSISEMSHMEEDFLDFINGRYAQLTVCKAGHCFFECASNAVMHGNKSESDKKVLVHVECGRRFLKFWIRDEGLKNPFPVLSKKRFSRNPTGAQSRGLRLVENFAHTVRLYNTNKTITCTIAAGKGLVPCHAGASR